LSALSYFGILPNKFLSLAHAPSYAQIIAITVTILISLLNYIGIRRAGLFQVIFTILKVALLITIALIGFTYANGSWGNFATIVPAKSSGFILVLVAALWAYDCWNV